MSIRLKIHFASTNPVRAWLDGNSSMLQPSPDTLQGWRPAGRQVYSIVDEPAMADAIVLIEPNYFKSRSYMKFLAAHPLVRQFGDKCFTIVSDDFPVGLLPGVYTSMSADLWEPGRFRAGCYIYQPNNFLPVVAAERDTHVPSQLYSFRGHASSGLRVRMFAMPELARRGTLVRTYGWCNHTNEQKLEFLRQILDSKFILCPAGVAPATHRVFEAMELGRVPVILSDHWMPPAGVAWADCSVRISEGRCSEVPDILAAMEPAAGEMGHLARREWERFFAPNVRLGRMVEQIEDLLLAGDARPSGAELIARWTSWRFCYGHRWTLPQRIKDGISNGRIRSRVRQLVRRELSDPDLDSPQWQAS